jgi:RNA polymerase subunit RPABC4/transcription elongation factor Spt4
MDITGPIGDAFNSFLSSEIVQLLGISIFVYLSIVWLAAAFWAFRDLHDRTENPVLPYLAAGLIILFSPFLFVFGVLVYRIVRPAERLGEVYERNLAEEALLAEVESVKTCRGCDRRVDEEWIICPWCRARLNRVCPNCERLVGLDWSLCAWCGKDFERPAAEVAASAPAQAFAPAPAATPVGQTSIPGAPRASAGTASSRSAVGR